MSFHWSDPRHALWGFLKFAIVAGVMLVLLAWNASKFDETEISFWIQMIAAWAGINGGFGAWKMLKQSNESENPV